MRYLFLLFLYLFSFTLFGADVHWNSRLEGSGVLGGSLRIEDGDFGLLGQGKFTDRSTSTFSYLRLGFGERYGMSYLGIETRVVLELKITPYNDQGLSETSYTQVMEVLYTPVSGGVSVDAEDLRLPGVHKFTAEVTSAKVYSQGNPQWSSTIPSFLYLEGGFQAERYYAFDYLTKPSIRRNYVTYSSTGSESLVYGPMVSTDVTTHEIELTWDYVLGAEQYELEWTWVDNYPPSGAVLGKDAISFSELDFTMNSTRVRLGSTSYRIPNTFAKGYLIYRVRGVGRWLDAIDKDKHGLWSSNTSTDKNYVSDWPDVVEIGVDHEQLKNWQYQATYAEDGKKKEVVQYFDGTQRNQETVTRINSTNQTVVGQTVYDNEGRGVIQILPVPQKNPAIQFYPSLNLNESGVPYNYENFDLETGTVCKAVPADPLSTSSGAGAYYSTTAHQGETNWQKNVPDAEGYAFTQVEYTSDNRNLIRNQSGVGTTHKIGGGHETYYYYDHPSQEELNRLFGYKIGYTLRYKKNIVIDANGQVSTSYLDAHGKVIATALSGTNTTPLSDLESGASSESMSHTDLLGKVLRTDVDTPSDLNKRGSTGNLGGEDDKLEEGSPMTVTEDGRYHFSYTKLSGAYTEPGCNGSPGVVYPYKYDISLSIKNDCGTEFFDASQWNISTTVVNGQETISYSTKDAGILLPKGSYMVSKTLVVDEPKYLEYLASYLDASKNPCLKTEADFTDQVDIDCDQSCDGCLKKLGSEEDFIAIQFSTEDLDTKTLSNEQIDSYTTTFKQMYSDMKRACVEPCEPISSCSSIWDAMRDDMAPGGQYGSDDLSGDVVSDRMSVYNSSNDLPLNSSTGVAYWKTVTYRNSDGSEAMIEVYSNGDGTFNIPLDNTTVSSSPASVGVEERTDGSYWTRLTNITNVSDFFALDIEDSWMDALVAYHPEYPLYLYASDVCTMEKSLVTTSGSYTPSVSLSSEIYDSYVRDEVTTYAQARGEENNLYLQGELYGLNVLGSDLSQISLGVNDPIYDTDPYFKINYPHHVFVSHGNTINNTDLKKNLMIEALVNYNHTGESMIMSAIRAVKSGYDFTAYSVSNPWKELDDSYKGLSTTFTKAEVDQIWGNYKFYYFTSKSKINQLLSDLYGFNLTPSLLNSEIGDGNGGDLGPGGLSLGIAPAFSQSAYLSTIAVELFSTWGVFSNFDHVPTVLAADAYNSKDIRVTRVDGGQNSSQDDQQQLDDRNAEAKAGLWAQKGLCPETFDLENLLSDLGKSDRLTQSRLDWNNVAMLVPDLVGSLMNVAHETTSESVSLVQSLQGKHVHLETSINTDGDLVINYNSDLSNAPALVAQLDQVGNLSWSSYGSTWHIYYLSETFIDAGNSHRAKVLIKAGATEATAKEYIVYFTSGIDLRSCETEYNLHNATDPNCKRKRSFENAMSTLMQEISKDGKVGLTFSLSDYGNKFTGTILEEYFGSAAQWDGTDAVRGTYIKNDAAHVYFNFNESLPKNNEWYLSFSLQKSTDYVLRHMSYLTQGNATTILPLKDTYTYLVNDQPRALNFDCSCEELKTSSVQIKKPFEGGQAFYFHSQASESIQISGGSSEEACRPLFDEKLKDLFNEALGKITRGEITSGVTSGSLHSSILTNFLDHTNLSSDNATYKIRWDAASNVPSNLTMCGNTVNPYGTVSLLVETKDGLTYPFSVTLDYRVNYQPYCTWVINSLTTNASENTISIELPGYSYQPTGSLNDYQDGTISSTFHFSGTYGTVLVKCPLVSDLPCKNDFEEAFKVSLQDIFKGMEAGRVGFRPLSLQNLQRYLNLSDPSIFVNWTNFTGSNRVSTPSQCQVDGLSSFHPVGDINLCFNGMNLPWVTAKNHWDYFYNRSFDLEDYSTGNTCCLSIKFPKDAATLARLQSSCTWVVSSVTYLRGGDLKIIINGDIELYGSLECPVVCPPDPSCTVCKPRRTEPISCNYAYSRFISKMNTLNAGWLGSSADALYVEPMTESHFCDMKFAYVTAAYLYYLETFDVGSVSDLYYLSISAFSNTPIGFSNEDLFTAVDNYYAYRLDLRSNPLTANSGDLWGLWVPNHYMKTVTLCPVITPNPVIPDIETEIPCKQMEVNQAIVNAKNQYQIYLNRVETAFRAQYVQGAINTVVETFDEEHVDREFHYTLYYYDRAGNLTQTVPPKGVDRLTLTASDNEAINTIRKDDPTRTSEDRVHNLTPSHTLQTDYRYNSLNQLVYQNTPDGGESRFGYDALGRLVVSQNAKQKVHVEFQSELVWDTPVDDGPPFNPHMVQVPYNAPQYSYTYYDELGRVVEVGEFTDKNNDFAIDDIGHLVLRDHPEVRVPMEQRDWLTQSVYYKVVVTIYTNGVPVPMFTTLSLDPMISRQQVTRTIYDELQELIPGQSNTPSYASVTVKTSATTTASVESQFGTEYSEAYKNNTRNRIVGVVYQSVYNSDVSIHDNGTFYAYDVHGNVKELIQVNNDANLLALGQNIKHFDYEYNLVSGNVNKVYYQKGGQDQYVHRYHYDADNRITHAETSKDDIRFEKDAKYFYYDHGPLARTELGDKKVQAEDYAYTIQGWLKTVNGEQVHSVNMLGDDALLASAQTTTSTPLNQLVGKDAFGFSLNYFDGDYKSANTSMLEYSRKTTGNFAAQHGPGLYNGNIRSMYTAISNLHENMPDASLASLETHQTVYGYDQLNRIKSMNGYYRTSAETSLTASEYASAYSYDANGNILSMTNYAKADDGTKKQMDAFSYNYLANNNQLLSVDDVISSSDFTGDVDDQQSNNYGYDEIGQLIKDDAEKIDKITWTVTNKVKKVIYKGDLQGKKIRFEYDAMGHRISKHVTSITGDVSSTYYVLDAQGNPMSTYEYVTNASDPLAQRLVLRERNIYGSKRVGIEQVGSVMTKVENSGMFEYPFDDMKVSTLGVCEEGGTWYLQDNPTTNYTVLDANMDGKKDLKITTTSGQSYFAANLSLESQQGLSYTVEFDLLSNNVPGLTLLAVGCNPPSGQISWNQNLSCSLPGHYTFTFTATESLNERMRIKWWSSMSTSLNAEVVIANLKISKVGDPFMLNNKPLNQTLTKQEIGDKRYELANHLGNVLNVVTDRKLPVADANDNTKIAYFTADVVSFADYLPFGQVMPNRHASDNTYRYGYQGSERDDEMKGDGESYVTHYRMYDPRLGRWFSTDPKYNAHESPYAGMANNPIIYNDEEGDTPGLILGIGGFFLGAAKEVTSQLVNQYRAFRIDVKENGKYDENGQRKKIRFSEMLKKIDMFDVVTSGFQGALLAIHAPFAIVQGAANAAKIINPMVDISVDEQKYIGGNEEKGHKKKIGAALKESILDVGLDFIDLSGKIVDGISDKLSDWGKKNIITPIVEGDIGGRAETRSDNLQEFIGKKREEHALKKFEKTHPEQPAEPYDSNEESRPMCEDGRVKKM